MQTHVGTVYTGMQTVHTRRHSTQECRLCAHVGTVGMRILEDWKGTSVGMGRSVCRSFAYSLRTVNPGDAAIHVLRFLSRVPQLMAAGNVLINMLTLRSSSNLLWFFILGH